MSIKSQPNLPVYDIDEFKDLIRKLKIRKNELTTESASLNSKIEEAAATYESAKKELNVLNVADEIRNESAEIASNSLLLDKKFIEDNKKLEISILNHDIKLSLPKLEQEAIIWEQKMHDIEKETLKTQEQMSQMPEQLTKTTAELEQVYSELLEEKAKLSASIKYKQDAKVQELKSTKMHINKLRSQITAIIDQHSLVQQSINRLHTAVLAEDTRAGILRREYDSLCKSYEQMLKNHEAESKEMT